MAQNLIDLLERLLGSNDVLSRLGALIGLSPERPGGDRRRRSGDPGSSRGIAQRPEGRDRLAALVQSQDTSVLDNVTGALEWRS